MATYHQLPVKPETGGRKTEGFMTPTADKVGQKMSVPPKRVIPIVFLPGIMGSCLRLRPDRQLEMHKDNNLAWSPDNSAESLELVNANPRRRQRQLDPQQTEVDIYDPVANPTGDKNESADQRHGNAKVKFKYAVDVSIDTPLLMDDPVNAKPRKTKEQKARERGWGEVYFGSYSQLLQMCELRLNTAFFGGKLSSDWKQIVGVNPAAWQTAPGDKGPTLPPLTEDELKQAVNGCWFPVHAMGYNWLQSNQKSAEIVADRITKLIKYYNDCKFQCEQVIVVTHSMGGLVARALIHPDMGGLQSQVLGMVHGVMPATGAGAAYKRMRCGFEDSLFSIVPKVLGNYGDEVTAVLGNAPGGLELLPSQAYGNDWLQVTHNGETLVSLPKKGDPYEEIYKLRGKWYGLLREKWLNPAKDKKGSGYDRTCLYLDQAKAFHNAIANTYHPNSYAHYGADPRHAAWHRVVWGIGQWWQPLPDVGTLQINSDNRQGNMQVIDPARPKPPGATTPGPGVLLQPAADPGDQTVPAHSADHQLQSGIFKGVFRQTGYEHQDSYQNENALNSTLYSLVRIAQTMKWSA